MDASIGLPLVREVRRVALQNSMRKQENGHQRKAQAHSAGVEKLRGLIQMTIKTCMGLANGQAGIAWPRPLACASVNHHLHRIGGRGKRQKERLDGKPKPDQSEADPGIRVSTHCWQRAR